MTAPSLLDKLRLLPHGDAAKFIRREIDPHWGLGRDSSARVARVTFEKTQTCLVGVIAESEKEAEDKIRKLPRDDMSILDEYEEITQIVFF